MIEIKDLSVAYKSDQRELYAVKNVDLFLEEGRSYGLVGESGSGKTSLAMAILRLLPPNSQTKGQIGYKGRNLNNISQEEMNSQRWKDLAVVFQESMNSFSPVHRLKTQFEDVYRVHFPKASSEKIRSEVLDLFNKFSLDEELYTAYPHELSGGMIQRVSIVLALILKPRLLVLDEATTALDVINEKQVLDIIGEIEREVSLTRINITHDISVVYRFCKKVIVMYGGHVFEIGNTKEVFKDPIHPYSKALLDSYPDISRRDEYIRPIPGSLPDLSKTYEGCIYYPRCPRSLELCKTTRPSNKSLGQRIYACHNPLGGRNE